MDTTSTHPNDGTDVAVELDHTADLQTVLAAWHTATVRLQKTHEALQAEVGRLTHELEMKNRQLARQSRLADLGQMASHVAHEVRNNLVPVSLYMSLLRRHIQGDNASLDVLNKVESGLTALDATVNDLLHFASDREPHRTACQLSSLVKEVQLSIAPQLLAQGIRCEMDLPEHVIVMADANMLRRAILNLTLNAIDAMPDGGDLEITLVEMAGQIELEIADSGSGFDDNARRQAMDPFYSTKNTGTGLGLAIVDRVAVAHGGSIRLDNCPQGGAAVTLCLPHTATGASRAAA